MPLTGPDRLANHPAPPPASPHPTPKPQVAAPGCQNCREQHLKCDRATPVCGRCSSAGRQCRRGFKFKALGGSFSRHQTWLRYPTQITYVDETEATARNYEPYTGQGGTYRPWEPDQQGLNNDNDCNDDDHVPSEPTPTTASIAGVSSVTLEDRSPAQATPSSRHRPVPGSPTDRFIVHEEQDGAQRRHRPVSQESRHGISYLFPDEADRRPPILYLERPVWPLGREEAFLFRHFVQNLATWLDLCDPSTSFQTVVPQRAGTCPTLLHAIFALSSRHLSHTTPNFDDLASNRYHQMCLQTLIPTLKHAGTVSDENLFAATIILRVLEEMEVRNSGMDARGHLLGIHAFVAGDNRQDIAPRTLSAASFWIGLRQEIYSAVMNHQPVRMNLSLPIVDRSLAGPAEDHVWANRAITHCADVLNFCFRDDEAAGATAMPAHSVARRWAELRDWGNSWRNVLPGSYDPVYEGQEDKDTPFPEIWYQTSCQIIGVQHNILAELFLTIFDPSIPRVGAQRKLASHRANNRVQGLLRKLCGIGLGNKWSPPALFTACMGVAAFGDRFETTRDQQAFIDMLRLTEREHARPTESVQRQMMRSWGWLEDGAD
ncbi:hypothetical protein RB598_009698 [Gaeumannomyces tritici]